ncbi:MAG TPA: 2,3-bisphosphoglycerate-independent phosphoglycerate mutase, partial [Candidatus Tumulicola sp.]|nr:2,3-bisphosphoglycerate-independent phosphoglycerate mutase [Candidatus Tumulicola sp.]
EFARNATLRRAIAQVERSGTLHLMGLLSDGCVHSSLVHLFALLDAAAKSGVRIAVHCFLDGRDTPPRSAQRYIAALEEKLRSIDRAEAIATVSGRYYAMDRDGRWERTERAYDAIARARSGLTAPSAQQAVEDAYARGEDDEFVLPAIVGTARPVRDGDACIFFNFRPDRARQLTTAFDAGVPDYRLGTFDAFEPQTYRDLVFATMTKYDEAYRNPVLFGPRPQADTFGEVLSRAGLHQLRLAETEKYAHVTYFFNGGREEPFAGEDRILIPSDRSVPTYDLAPAMRAREITDAAIEAIGSGKYDAVVMNYANADMVGHTGKWEPTVRAVEILDQCLERLRQAVCDAGGVLAVTADHGNAEEKIDSEGRPLTAHTTNQVPLLLIGLGRSARLAAGGKLGDVAPTLLRIAGLPVPAKMTGANLLTGSADSTESSRPLSG